MKVFAVADVPNFPTHCTALFLSPILTTISNMLCLGDVCCSTARRSCRASASPTGRADTAVPQRARRARMLVDGLMIR